MIAWFYSEPHYRDHLLPIVNRLNETHDLVGGEGPVAFLEAQKADLVLVASRRDSRRFSRVVMVEHGAGQRYGNNAGGPDTPEPQVELFLAPSQRVADQDAAVYPNARRIPVGSPRVEYLARQQRAPERVVIAFHWEAGTARESRSAWTHHQRALPSLAQRHPMLGHGHPRMLRRLLPSYRKSGIPVEADWETCLRQAKALVCDNSSIVYEAAACGIPVVLLDAPWYTNEWGMRFWEHADMGPRTGNPGDVADLVDEVLLSDVWVERRAEVAREVYGELEGSTERAVGAILSV